MEVDFRIKSGLVRSIISKSLVLVRLDAGSGNGFRSHGSYVVDLTNANEYQKAWIGFAAGREYRVRAIRLSVDTPKPYLLPEALEAREVKLLLEKQQAKH